MESRRTKGKSTGATQGRRVSLDLTDRSDTLDLMLMEAMERLERVRSKAVLAVGTMLAEHR